MIMLALTLCANSVRCAGTHQKNMCKLRDKWLNLCRSYVKCRKTCTRAGRYCCAVQQREAPTVSLQSGKRHLNVFEMYHFFCCIRFWRLLIWIRLFFDIKRHTIIIIYFVAFFWNVNRKQNKHHITQIRSKKWIKNEYDANETREKNCYVFCLLFFSFHLLNLILGSST